MPREFTEQDMARLARASNVWDAYEEKELDFDEWLGHMESILRAGCKKYAVAPADPQGTYTFLREDFYELLDTAVALAQHIRGAKNVPELPAEAPQKEMFVDWFGDGSKQ